MAAAVMDAAKSRDVVLGYLDYPSRHYNCDYVNETYDKKFYPESSNVQLARYAEDKVGMYSDSFILYAISMLGVADVEGIRLFLDHYRSVEKDLAIIDCSTKEALTGRLEVLHKNGFIFRHLYTYTFANAENEEVEATAALYTLSNSAHDFMNQRLQRKVLCNNWISAKPIAELVGIASCGYVSGMVAKKCSGKVEQKQGIVKTKAIGTYIIPSILKVSEIEQGSLYVGFMPAFLKKDEAIMTEADYEDRCIRLVNIIKQYFYSYDQKGKKSVMVVVVENTKDLAMATSWISRTKILDGDLSRIFFTGEGDFVNKVSDKMESHFVQMKRANTAAGYTLVSAGIPGVIR